MRHPFKIPFKFATSLIILGSFINPLPAQEIKKTTTSQKKTAIVTNKTAASKTKATTTAKKTAAVKTKTTAVKKTIPPKSNPPKTSPAELNMSTRETQMVDEINLVRSDPSGYTKFVKEFLNTSKAGKRTIAAANELIDELKHLQPLNKLRINMDMYRDARDYGKTMMENNSIEHSDLPYNENLSFGIEDIREVVIDLLIDEDIPNRGHRRNILKKDISMVAVHELPGTVEDYQHCYIQEFK